MRYKVTILTSDSTSADSDSDVYYTIIGREGRTKEEECDIFLRDDRERGSNESWTIDDDEEIGEYMCLQLRISGNDGWLFEEVGERRH